MFDLSNSRITDALHGRTIEYVARKEGRGEDDELLIVCSCGREVVLKVIDGKIQHKQTNVKIVVPGLTSTPEQFR